MFVVISLFVCFFIYLLNIPSDVAVTAIYIFYQDISIKNIFYIYFLSFSLLNAMFLNTSFFFNFFQSEPVLFI